MRKINLTGRRFGRLTVIEEAGRDKFSRTLWKCECECGNEKIVPYGRLVRGDTRSCGCLAHDTTVQRNLRHGDSFRGKVERLYSIYNNIKTRCYNETDSHYERWGGRGIKMCDEWRESYDAFKEWALANGYEDNLTIERIDNDGDYCPENCKWITHKQQARNKRNNHFLTYNGERKCLGEWCEIYNIPRSTLWNRVDRGWTPEECLFGRC